MANDITLIKYGTEIVWSDTPWLLFGALIAFGIILWIVLEFSGYLTKQFMELQVQKTWLFRSLTALCFVSIYQLHLYPYFFEDKKYLPIVEEASFNLVTLSIMRNVTPIY